MLKSNEQGKRWSPKSYRRNHREENGRWHIQLGDRLIRQGKYQQGLKEYNKALKLMVKHT